MNVCHIYPSFVQSNFLEAGDFHTASFFHGIDILRCLHNRFMRAGVKPGPSARQDIKAKGPIVDIGLDHLGDFKFAPGRRG